MTGSPTARRAVALVPGIAMIAALLPLPAAAEPFRPPPAKDGFSYPDCYCTNRDQRVEVGGYSCLTVGGERFLAQCDLSLNNTIWRKVDDICPTAEVRRGRAEMPAGQRPHTTVLTHLGHGEAGAGTLPARQR